MEKIEIESFMSNKLKDICEDKTSAVDMQAELNEVGINSLEFIEFIVQLEEHFNIEFSDENLVIERYARLADVVDIVWELVQ